MNKRQIESALKKAGVEAEVEHTGPFSWCIRGLEAIAIDVAIAVLEKKKWTYYDYESDGNGKFTIDVSD